MRKILNEKERKMYRKCYASYRLPGAGRGMTCFFVYFLFAVFGLKNEKSRKVQILVFWLF